MLHAIFGTSFAIFIIMSDFTSNIATEARTAGGHALTKSIQSWRTPKNIAPEITSNVAQNDILNSLEKASVGKVGRFDTSIKTANAYAGAPQTRKNSDEAFQFKDVIDIVNPLQHFPLIGTAYRNITGDELHPMSQIIGGAIYGGPIGAISGTANAITKVQTGKDIGDHALELAGLGRKNISTATEIKLNEVASKLEASAPIDDLPQSAQAFAGVAEPHKAAAIYEKVAMAEGRTAGSTYVRKNWAKASPEAASVPAPVIDIQKLVPIETVTSLSLSAMPPRRNA
jgi:hypothetical protein